MEFHIEPSMPISKLKEQFNYAFPYLKIEFFTKAHGQYNASSSESMVHSQDTSVAELSSTAPHEILKLDPHMKVKQFESLMEKDFGLHLQVFRKSGHAWLATSVTDSLSLQEQNHKGMESLAKPAEQEPMDYREQD